jgi:hypothetical protein
MSLLLVLLLIAAIIGVSYGLLWRFGPLLLMAYDRAWRNPRDRIEPAYERPVYARREVAARWPGWDGWYVLVMPRQADVPVKAMRLSIMTGLYGLDGIDDYAALQGLSAFDAVEFLVMLQTQEASHLFRRYLPKATDLAIRREQLLVAVKDWGQIGGRWPDYRVQMRDPTRDIEVSLTCRGKDLLWWADLPRLFTYVAAFGELQGTLTFEGREYDISGPGTFEHGFARKPFNFDPLLRPLRLLQKLIPLTLIHYHYNLLMDAHGFHGGIMVAQGLGIAFRDIGGLYWPDGRFTRLRQIAVEYLEMERLSGRSFTPAIPFPKTWRVRAQAEGGALEYTATREAPPAPIAAHMMYCDYRYEGTWRDARGQVHALAGRGYGEYVRI